MKMNRWVGKVAVVTGASAGIGLTIAKALIREEMIVVGLARRKTLMESEMKNFEGKGKFHAIECDISKEEEVIEAFDWIKKNLKTVHVLINNAGIITMGKILDSNKEEWDKMFSINVMGLLHCTQQAVKMMKEFGEEGHIININSITGHRLIRHPGVNTNVYPATKHAVTALTASLGLELLGTKIKTTSISPGRVETSIVKQGDIPASIKMNLPALEPEDIADSVVYVLSTPPKVQVTELTIQPTGEIF